MFNGIIHKTGIVRFVKREFNSSFIGIETNLNFKANDRLTKMGVEPFRTDCDNKMKLLQYKDS